MYEWTFGIVTNGKKMDQISRIIESIRSQGIPNYEIIICGTYPGKIDQDMKYIPFTERDDKGWITKKKNLICQQAKYDNLFICHDRICLDKGWYKGMRKYGDDFDILCCKITYNGQRAYDWLTTARAYNDYHRFHNHGGYLDYDAFDKFVYCDGGMTIMKKWVWQLNPFPEDRYLKQEEDLKFSHLATQKGFRIQFNLYSSVKTLSFGHPISKLSIDKNGKIHGPLYLIIGKKLLSLYKEITIRRDIDYDKINNI